MQDTAPPPRAPSRPPSGRRARPMGAAHRHRRPADPRRPRRGVAPLLRLVPGRVGTARARLVRRRGGRQRLRDHRRAPRSRGAPVRAGLEVAPAPQRSRGADPRRRRPADDEHDAGRGVRRPHHGAAGRADRAADDPGGLPPDPDRRSRRAGPGHPVEAVPERGRRTATRRSRPTCPRTRRASRGSCSPRPTSSSRGARRPTTSSRSSWTSSGPRSRTSRGRTPSASASRRTRSSPSPP